MKFKKALNPIIATILILIITAISVMSFLSWYSEYDSKISNRINMGFQPDTANIETIIGSTLYIKSIKNDSINAIKFGNTTCENINYNITEGVNEIDLEDCIKNLKSPNQQVTIITDNQVLNKNVYLKDITLDIYSEKNMNSCSLDGIILSHNESATFYKDSFAFDCQASAKNLICINGIIDENQTYMYYSCNTYNTCSIGNETLLHGENLTFYLESFNANGCINQTRICENGNLSGTYTYKTCTSDFALGGDQVFDIQVSSTTYRVHKFINTQVSDFEVINPEGLSVEYLIVAGGGGGGYGGAQVAGSGGGAGGFITGTIFLSSGNYDVKVGSGGQYYTNGENSYLDNIVAIGGGFGSGSNGLSSSGGSGGGASGSNIARGLGTSGQGYNGGTGTGTHGWTRCGGGGGGGAGGVGQNSPGVDSTATGGLGVSSQIDGTLRTYAQGGMGNRGTGSTAGANGSSNTGSGGGGGEGGSGYSGGGGAGGTGGSGVVIIRYAIN